jgi:copper chaperone CopZ
MNAEPSTTQGSKRTGTIIAIFCGVAVLLGYGAYRLVNTSRDTRPPSASATGVSIPVEGMSCGACVARVKKTLKALPGVNDAHVSLEHREAEISYEPALTSLDKLKGAIDEMGYKSGTPKPKEKSP